MALGGRRPGPHDRLHERPLVLLRRFGAELLLAHGRVHDAALVHPEFDLARLQFLDRPSHVHGHGARLRVRHEPPGPEHLAERPELAHHVRRGTRHVGVEPSPLAPLDVLHADVVRTGRLALLRLLALGDHQHPDLLPGAVGEAHGAAHHLVGVLGIDPEAHRDIDRLVEFGVRRRFHLVHGLARGVQLAGLERRDGGAIVLAVRAHQSTTSSPMERAVPATIFIAASMSVAFRSGSLISAIFLSWARVTFPTFWRFEVGEPFSMPASFFRSTAAGGVLVMNVNVRSLKIVTSTGVIIPTWPIRNGIVSCGSSSFTASSMPSRRFTSSGRSGIGSRPVPTNLMTPWMPLIVWSVSWFLSMSTST